MDWLGNCYINILTNNEAYTPDGYGEFKVQATSYMEKIQFDTKSPNYFRTAIQEYIFEDRSDYLQVGFFDEISYYQMYYG